MDVVLFSSCAAPPNPRNVSSNINTPAAKLPTWRGAARPCMLLIGAAVACTALAAVLACAPSADPHAACWTAAATALLTAAAATVVMAVCLAVCGGAAAWSWLSHITAAGAWWPAWHQPVRAVVQGGYTISPREDWSSSASSPECLVTCILKVGSRV